jgi:hypothetical protein
MNRHARPKDVSGWYLRALREFVCVVWLLRANVIGSGARGKRPWELRVYNRCGSGLWPAGEEGARKTCKSGSFWSGAVIPLVRYCSRKGRRSLRAERSSRPGIVMMYPFPDERRHCRGTVLAWVRRSGARDLGS